MPNELLLRNKSTIAVITGGTQGLGLAVAKRLALEGAPGIVISGRNSRKGDSAAKEVRALGTDCLFVTADAAIVDDCHRLIDSALQRVW
jgi:NAD(P)-dependent dehydrogenase (short-subunit alcohol dehydrogenase family)